jgi:hypothetical protein
MAGFLAGLAVLLTGTGPTRSEQNSLLVEQIGDNNRAVSYQGAVPNTNAVEEALGTPSSMPLFDLLDTGTLENASNVTPLSVDRSIKDLLNEFQGRSGGRNNSAEIRQNGSRNKALSVQVDGSNNRLLTKQTGNDNIGVHLQRGSNNNTELVQINGENENALIAEGNVVGNDGGPLQLRAEGGVKGFSIRADGPQATFSTVTVQPNQTGGLNIALE